MLPAMSLPEESPYNIKIECTGCDDLQRADRSRNIKHVTLRTLRGTAEAGCQVCRMLCHGYDYYLKGDSAGSHEDEFGTITLPSQKPLSPEDSKLVFNPGRKRLNFYLREGCRTRIRYTATVKLTGFRRSITLESPDHWRGSTAVF